MRFFEKKVGALLFEKKQHMMYVMMILWDSTVLDFTGFHKSKNATGIDRDSLGKSHKQYVQDTSGLVQKGLPIFENFGDNWKISSQSP